jgi:hypothetical protein
VGAASGIVVEFKLATAQAGGVVFDLRSVAHVRGCAHVLALPDLTSGREV